MTADRATLFAAESFNPDWRPRPSLRAWIRWPRRCWRLWRKGWNG